MNFAPDTVMAKPSDHAKLHADAAWHEMKEAYGRALRMTARWFIATASCGDLSGTAEAGVVILKRLAPQATELFRIDAVQNPGGGVLLRMRNPFSSLYLVVTPDRDVHVTWSGGGVERHDWLKDQVDAGIIREVDAAVKAAQ